MKRLVWVDFCCNRNGGYFDEKVTAIQFPDLCFAIERHFDGLRFTETENGIRLLRKTFPVISCDPCVGNWFWNGYLMHVEVAAELLVRCKRSGKFGFDSGWQEFANWWDMPQEAEPPLHWLICHLVDAQKDARR